MSPKQKLSALIVFASVFLGSFLGAGITIVTTPKTATKELNSKLKGTAEAVRETITERFDNATIRLIEQSTKILTRSKSGVSRFSTLLSFVRENIQGFVDRKGKKS